MNEILALLKEAPFGSYRTKAGLILRKALLINGTLFNSEAWHGITEKQVEDFSKLDHALLRGILGGHAKIATSALYLETSQIPFKHILACRRILYLHTILKRSKDELINKVYLAQKEDPSNGDFCKLVLQDFKLLEMQISEEEIESMTRCEFKKLVKAYVKKSAYKYLTLKEKRSKLDNIK